MQIFGQFVLNSGTTPENWLKSRYFMNWLRFKVLRNQKQSSQSQNQRYTLGLKRYLTMTFGRKINKNTHWIKSYWTRTFILDCVFSYLDWIQRFTFQISVFCPNAKNFKFSHFSRCEFFMNCFQSEGNSTTRSMLLKRFYYWIRFSIYA